MAQLTLVAPPELAAGFRLAGTSVVVVDSAQEAEVALERLAADPDVGVIGVYAPFLDGLEPSARSRFEDMVAPVVVAVPVGVEGPEAGDHRARLTSLLQRAIGYRISFGEGEES